MHFDIFTLFPTMFQGPFSESILKRAQERRLLSIALHNIRDATTDKHHIVDDYPYGGGAGMVMKPEPIFAAIEAVHQKGPIIYLTPQGRLFNQQIAQELAQEPCITLLCGHYEGIDERVCQHLVTDEISIGDYVLSGGELPAMVLIDAVTRLLPGALGHVDSAEEDSFTDGLLDCPHYTRPEVYADQRVPDVLLSGNHAHIRRWRMKQSLGRTFERRADLLESRSLSGEEKKLLEEYLRERDDR